MTRASTRPGQPPAPQTLLPSLRFAFRAAALVFVVFVRWVLRRRG